MPLMDVLALTGLTNTVYVPVNGNPALVDVTSGTFQVASPVAVIELVTIAPFGPISETLTGEFAGIVAIPDSVIFTYPPIVPAKV